MMRGVARLHDPRRLRREADAARDRGDWPEAARLYQLHLATAQGSEDVPIWVQLGHALKESGARDKALAAYRRATELAPGDDDARLHLDGLLRLEPASAQDCEQPAPRATDALAAADAARDARDWSRAKTLYEAYLADPVNAGRATIWIQLGHARKEAGYSDDALAAYEHAAMLAPELADARLQLGHLLKTMGAVEPARGAYRRALQLDPDLSAARLELERLGPGEEADGRKARTPPPERMLNFEVVCPMPRPLRAQFDD